MSSPEFELFGEKFSLEELKTLITMFNSPPMQKVLAGYMKTDAFRSVSDEPFTSDSKGDTVTDTVRWAVDQSFFRGAFARTQDFKNFGHFLTQLLESDPEGE